MIIKKYAQTKDPAQVRRWILLSGQICLLCGIALSRAGDPLGAFLTGMCYGYAMVANLYFLATLNRSL